MWNSSDVKTKSSEAIHQSGTETAEPDGEQDPPEGDDNPHNPETARKRGAVALRSLVIGEQIKQTIQGG